ncbi:MAG TPA: hypothetical protein ENI45_01715 [Thermoplasmatales archaeon]|nr:hypothetical protein [Thermoplasmatales archaeon]
MKNVLWRKGLAVIFIMIFFNLTFSAAIGKLTLYEYKLPPPASVDMPVEETFFRRMSVREFTEEPVTNNELSTVLWAAYGCRDDGEQTVPVIDGMHAVEIYVLKKDGVYKYDPLNHSLLFYRNGDYRYIGQYNAPIQLGIVWNRSRNTNGNYVAAEMGAIGQNIQFMANALGLGTVVTADFPPNNTLYVVGLPPDEVPRIIMPVGHPRAPYNFIYLPLWFSLLPRVRVSDVNLSTAIKEWETSTVFHGDISRWELSQLLWASYGYSYLLDVSRPEKKYITRHRTVPSAHAYYPLRMYAVTKNGVYRYVPGLYRYYMWGLPIVTFLLKIRDGDHRGEVAQASSQPSIASAPLIIISVLDTVKARGMLGKWDDLSGEEFRWLWYYEAGASVYNILLETVAWNLSADITLPMHSDAIRGVLRLNDECLPLLIVPVGK